MEAPASRARAYAVRPGDRKSAIDRRALKPFRQRRHPFRALPTPVISSLISTLALRLRSKAVQADSGRLPSATLTPRMSSLIATMRSPLQSPPQIWAIAVAVGVGAPGVTAVAVGDDVAVAVAVPNGDTQTSCSSS